MRAFRFGRCALGISLLGAFLSACGGGSSVPIAADNTLRGATGAKHHQTFSYTGTKQTFIVPAGVTRLTVFARGGEGSGGFYHGSGIPGFPGRVYAVVRVHSGEKLYVFVAGSGAHGGFNGGGAGGGAEGLVGGGASDVRTGGDALKDRIIVAAGGGTAGGCEYYCYADGGEGGGLSGKQGCCGGGGHSGGGGAGGTQSAGGLGGAGGTGHTSGESGQPGGNGTLGQGGSGGKGGGSPSSDYIPGIVGSGGGGGYYGGGGGGGSASVNYSSDPDFGGGGGGGGSSYVEPSAIASRMWTGWEAVGKGDGQVIFSWN
jgi:hypothetical protein